jgi:hypothetical protein
MGSSIIPAASAGNPSDNYQLISSVSASGSSVSFTSISGYKKLMLRCNALSVSGGNKTWTLRLNADSGYNYDYAFHYDGSTPNYRGLTVTGQTTFGFAQTGEILSAFFTMVNTDTTGVKSIEGSFKLTDTTPVSYTSSDYSGNYYASASISTVTLSTGTGTLSGTISLYGVAA